MVFGIVILVQQSQFLVSVIICGNNTEVILQPWKPGAWH